MAGDGEEDENPLQIGGAAAGNEAPDAQHADALGGAFAQVEQAKTAGEGGDLGGGERVVEAGFGLAVLGVEAVAIHDGGDLAQGEDVRAAGGDVLPAIDVGHQREAGGEEHQHHEEFSHFGCRTWRGRAG